MHEEGLLHPAQNSAGGLDELVVARVPGQAGAQSKHACVGDGALVRPAAHVAHDLPPQAAAAVVGVPAVGHRVVHVEGEVGVGGVARVVGVGREVSLGSLEHGEPPEDLVVVGLNVGLVRHAVEVVAVALLVADGALDRGHVRVVVADLPRVDHAAKHEGALPPVVRLLEHPDGTAVSGAEVVVHDAVDELRGGAANGVGVAHCELEGSGCRQDRRRHKGQGGVGAGKFHRVVWWC